MDWSSSLFYSSLVSAGGKGREKNMDSKNQSALFRWVNVRCDLVTLQYHGTWCDDKRAAQRRQLRADDVLSQTLVEVAATQMS